MSRRRIPVMCEYFSGALSNFWGDEADLCSAAGLKAAIHNPNVNEEAKEAAKERLDAM